MKLYINGDSHSAAAEAVNNHAFAEDDGEYFQLGRAPHPDNKRVSWGRKLADILKFGLFLDAESASSNTRIIRTTNDWLSTQKNLDEILVIIQWSTWERQEWLIDNQYFQVNASGIDHVPQSHQQQYKEFIVDINWDKCTKLAHQEIYDFHVVLKDKGIKHIFFNGNTSFAAIPISDQKEWGTSYMSPYTNEGTFNDVLTSAGFDTVSPISYHFGKESHSFFAKHMLQYIISNKMV